MHRLLRGMGWCFAALSAFCVLGLLVFDLTMVRPVVSMIEDRLRTAAPSERQPPEALRDMLRRAYGDRINGLVADQALWAPPSLVDGMHTLRHQFTRLGVALLLPLHLSDTDIAAAYLATAYLGSRELGYAKASTTYLGIELDRVSVEQAARLVAIAHSPHAYLDNPERLQRKTQQLLSHLAQAG